MNFIGTAFFSKRVAMARRGYSLLFALGLFLSDMAAIVIGFYLAYFFRFQVYFHFPYMPVPLEVPPLIRYIFVMPFVLMTMGLCFWAGGLYRESLSFKRIIRIGSIVKQNFYGIAFLIVLSAFYRDISFSRIFIILCFPLFSILVVFGRYLIISLESFIRQIQKKTRSLLIIGDKDTAYKLTSYFNKELNPLYNVMGFISINKDEKSIKDDLNFLGNIDNIEQLLNKYSPDEIIVSTMNIDHVILTDVITLCDRRMIQFFIVPDIFNLLTSKVELTSVGGINLIGLQKLPLDNGLNRLLKRMLDLMGALLFIVLFSWLFIFVALLIKLTSKGSVFYKQIRCHEDGKEFFMYKFRTMIENAEKESGPVWANENDKRRTRFGAILRSLNIDELPQLINVLRGEMSLVGPRPERPHFISQFKMDIPRYMARHAIKPGITGWAQVNGWRGNTSLEERIKYDLYYIENWSIWLDLKIIFMTIFSFKNAY